MQNDVTGQKPTFQPCACTLEAPAPDCQRGQELRAAIDGAANHAQWLRELITPVSEGSMISATDAIEERYNAYAYHVECQNPSREILYITLESLYRILSERRERGQITAIDCSGYEGRAAAETAEVARMVATLAEQALVPYIHPDFGLQAIMPLERDIAEHAQELAAAYLWHHPEPQQSEAASQGEPGKRITVIRLDMSEQELRDMKTLFLHNIERHQADIKKLEQIRQWLIEDGPDDNGPHPLVIPCIDLLETMFEVQTVQINRSIEGCRRGVAEVDWCLSNPIEPDEQTTQH